MPMNREREHYISRLRINIIMRTNEGMSRFLARKENLGVHLPLKDSSQMTQEREQPKIVQLNHEMRI